METAFLCIQTLSKSTKIIHDVKIDMKYRFFLKIFEKTRDIPIIICYNKVSNPYYYL